MNLSTLVRERFSCSRRQLAQRHTTSQQERAQEWSAHPWTWHLYHVPPCEAQGPGWRARGGRGQGIGFWVQQGRWKGELTAVETAHTQEVCALKTDKIQAWSREWGWSPTQSWGAAGNNWSLLGGEGWVLLNGTSITSQGRPRTREYLDSTYQTQLLI